MIIEFSFENFLSFRDMQTLSFAATKTVSKNKEVDDNNIIQVDKKLKLLRTLAVSGANASGKSNLTKTFAFFLGYIQFSIINVNYINLLYKPFILNDYSKDKPAFFQITTYHEGIKYRYGFEILAGTILSEWFFYTPKQKEVMIFTREKQIIKTSHQHMKEGKLLVQSDIISQTALFLTVAHSFNIIVAKEFFKTLNIYRSHEIYEYYARNYTEGLLDQKDQKESILQLLNKADFSIIDIEKDKATQIIKTSRSIYDKDQKKIKDISFNMDKMESAGTKRFFSITGMLLSSLKNGHPVIIDEFDASLHPNLTKKIVKLYNSPKTNPHNAQLLFVTHDVTLLDAELLRRDQIYFTEKDRYGASSLYSLQEIKGTRNDSSFIKNYLQGIYGAVPYFDNLEVYIEELMQNEP